MEKLGKLGEQIKRSQAKAMALKHRRVAIDQQLAKQEEQVVALQMALIAHLQANQSTADEAQAVPSKPAAVRKSDSPKRAGRTKKTAIRKVDQAAEGKQTTGRPDVSAAVMEIVKDGSAWTPAELKQALEKRQIRVVNISSTIYHLMKKNKVKRLKTGKNKGKYAKV